MHCRPMLTGELKTHVLVSDVYLRKDQQQGDDHRDRREQRPTRATVARVQLELIPQPAGVHSYI